MTPHHIRSGGRELPKGTRTDGVGHDGASLNRRPKASTAPAGLFAPAPEVVVKPKPPKVRKPRPSRAKNPADYKPRKAAVCGTDSGYKKHHREGTETCEPCRRAHAVVQQKYNAQRPKRKQYVRPNCGTREGYDSHRSHKERACDPCRLAHNAHQRARRSSIAGRELQPRVAVATCGTASGYKKHRRLGEEACAECLKAKRVDDAEYRAARRNAA